MKFFPYRESKAARLSWRASLIRCGAQKRVYARERACWRASGAFCPICGLLKQITILSLVRSKIVSLIKKFTQTASGPPRLKRNSFDEKKIHRYVLQLVISTGQGMIRLF